MTAALNTELLMSDQTENESSPDLRAKRKKMLALKLKEERLYKGLTQTELAASIGLKRYNISDVESGRSRDILSLWEIADGLETPLGVLIARVDRAIEDRLEEERLGLVEPSDDADPEA